MHSSAATSCSPRFMQGADVIRAPLLRWIVLSSLLAMTIVGAVYPVDETPSLRPPRPPHATRVAPVEQATAPLVADNGQADVDPFAPRGWQALPTPTLAPAAAPVSEFVGPLQPPPPPGPPPLPFQYMGRLTDGGAPVVYLSHGDQALIARNGETLEGTFKVVDISALQIEFLHLPTGQKQSMSLPAPDN